MFKKNKKGEVLIINCLNVALSILKSKIISDDKSSIGIIFYGSVCIFNNLIIYLLIFLFNN
jgi:hypothetical protein